MDELEQEYKGRIDFLKFDLSTNEGYCEFSRYGFGHIPAMLFFSTSGQISQKIEEFQDKNQLKARLDSLLTPAPASTTPQ